MSSQAPQSKDAKKCHHCQKPFGFMMSGRHHCRNCGNSCCQSCSQNTRDIPQHGLARARVCGPCAKELDIAATQVSPPVAHSLNARGTSTNVRVNSTTAQLPSSNTRVNSTTAQLPSSRRAQEGSVTAGEMGLFDRDQSLQMAGLLESDNFSRVLVSGGCKDVSSGLGEVRVWDYDTG
jgi:hypothetical protein